VVWQLQRGQIGWIVLASQKLERVKQRRHFEEQLLIFCFLVGNIFNPAIVEVGDFLIAIFDARNVPLVIQIDIVVICLVQNHKLTVNRNIILCFREMQKPFFF